MTSRPLEPFDVHGACKQAAREHAVNVLVEGEYDALKPRNHAGYAAAGALDRLLAHALPQGPLHRLGMAERSVLFSKRKTLKKLERARLAKLRAAFSRHTDTFEEAQAALDAYEQTRSEIVQAAPIHVQPYYEVGKIDPDALTLTNNEIERCVRDTFAHASHGSSTPNHKRERHFELANRDAMALLLAKVAPRHSEKLMKLTTEALAQLKAGDIVKRAVEQAPAQGNGEFIPKELAEQAFLRWSKSITATHGAVEHTLLDALDNRVQDVQTVENAQAALRQRVKTAIQHHWKALDEGR